MAAVGRTDQRRDAVAVLPVWIGAASEQDLYHCRISGGEDHGSAQGVAVVRVHAGIDLTLALVAEDHGDGLAQEIAGWLVVFSRRPGGQSQFSAQLSGQLADRDPLRDLQTWIVEHPEHLIQERVDEAQQRARRTRERRAERRRLLQCGI